MLDRRCIQKNSNCVSKVFGFTLIELMITIAVMAVLLVVAAPSFTDAVLGMKLNSHANNLVASTYTARSEAIKRNAVITLCVSGDGVNCANTGGWEQGWIVMCNTVDNTTCNAAGTDRIVIQRQSAASSGFKVTGVATGTSTILRNIAFQPSGIGATPATITVCRAAPSVGKAERVIAVSATGRTSVTKTATGTCT